MPGAVAQKTSIGQWQKTFPLQISTETLSLVFVKKLFAVAVSNVAFVRKLFPDHAFFDKNLEGLNLKILKEEASCPGTCKVVFWLRGCFDAIEKKYLRKATLALYEDPNDPKTISESFSFTFKYDGVEGAAMEFEVGRSSDSENPTAHLLRDERIKTQTKSLLNTILAAGKMLGPLPKKMMLTMKLQYYDSAPSDYMPNGFKVDENPQMVFESGPVNLKVGLINTDFHSMRMLVHASPSLIIAPPEKLKSALEVSKSKDGGQNFPGITIKSSNICHTPHSSCQQTQPELEEQAEENFEVACPCGVNCDDGVMILCDGCEKWQHAVCFRIIDDSDIPKSHLCNICAETKPELLESGSKTDQTLTGLTEEQAKSVCLFRRAVLLCVDNDLLSVGIISKRLSIETNIARGLLNRLQDEGAVKDVRGRGGNKAVLKAHVEAILLPRFFSLSTESHNVQDEAKQLGKRAAATKGKRGGGTSEMSSLASATEDLQIGNEISILSQESTDSPRPSKRRRTYNTVNTPIPVAPH